MFANNNLIWVDKKKSKELLCKFFCEVNEDFVPILSDRVDIMEYAEKLSRLAENIMLFEEDGVIASASVYMNQRVAFISSIAVKRHMQGRGLGKLILHQIESKAKELECEKLQLKVHCDNQKAIVFYNTNGYIEMLHEDKWITMEKNL